MLANTVFRRSLSGQILPDEVTRVEKRCQELAGRCRLLKNFFVQDGSESVLRKVAEMTFQGSIFLITFLLNGTPHPQPSTTWPQ